MALLDSLFIETLIAASDVPLLGALAGDVMFTMRAWRHNEWLVLCEVTAGAVAVVVDGVEGRPTMTVAQREARVSIGDSSSAGIVTLQLVARENGSQAGLVEVYTRRRVRRQ